jgi:hypothetical protein
VAVLPLGPLAAAGAIGGFLAGRIFGQPTGPAAGGPATPAPADSSLAGTASDVWDSWGTASLNFAGSDAAGALSGVTPIPPEQPPPGSPVIPPPPSPSGSTAIACWPGHPRPAGVNRWISVRSSHFRLWYASGPGTVKPGPYGTQNFDSWAWPNVTLKTSTGGTATFAKIRTGVYVHTSDVGISWHNCPAGSV